MNFLEMQNRVKLMLGFRTANTADIIALLQEQQQELEHEPQLPTFLKAETTSLTCTASTERMAVPTGFLREWDEDKLWVRNPDYDETHWDELEKGSPMFLRPATQDEGEGIPRAYAYDQTSFLLFPTPDIVYTFRTIYYKAEPVLSADGDTNKWSQNLPYLLVGRAGLILATGLRDQMAMSVFSQLVMSETVKLNNYSTDRDTAGTKYVMGGDD